MTLLQWWEQSIFHNQRSIIWGMEAMFQGDNHFSKIKSMSEANATKHLISLENVPIMDDIVTLKKMIKHIHIQIAPQLVSKS